MGILQQFTQGYDREDNIAYEMYLKEESNYLRLNSPWEGNKRGGTIEYLKSLARKTVFSNKVAMHFTDTEFDLSGRSSDIISYLLQMAENGLIQKYTLSVKLLDSGRFNLKVWIGQI